ncbi:hypothetical protein Z043_116130 [Scleropages formosus]|uniref:AT-rich interactive domain-containing protein 3B-like n=1 Tax=Scleropages formosus TaxID=113540 RepID=A0A0P7WP26_SCLFO|nr:hypothetical protein Z043_116130 [Scleropages formosus]
MVDNSGGSSSKAQMPSLSQEGGLGGGYPQGGMAGVKLEAVMEQLQRQQQARLEMERKERHLREAHIIYAQQMAAQQAILAAASTSGTPLGTGFLAKALPGGVSALGPQTRVSNQSSVDSEREDEDGRGRDSESGSEEGEEELMEAGEGSEEDRAGGGSALEYLRKQTLALQQGTSRPRPYPSAGGAQPAPSPPVRVKQEPEDGASPTRRHFSTSPNGQADWSYDDPFKQVHSHPLMFCYPPQSCCSVVCNFCG